ncbi:hypothetical protein [Leptospira noguchii]|uniref:Uncharacterized protein n=1 Tax=Leptospira noguchii serovar Autumnalis str. ZUN142 TaxID=1085540 RepID=M6USB7_9LEPT|nr:hypothetical protein [Leptospira noguchii]EKR71752.1 hypothetical protein LEP1GSC041_2225 [Leptospira noguchii str. 2006001870]EMO25044.1 hypothetical protein LEP1GSC170_5047 [Leptospira interrogans serovar Bataviae str. HAI135]EMO40178.1 hypothetical protein LEP1GSC186_3933 [Leptospira noguchii serovar Autumnalis str. ZUN142]UOG41858.1 hypothetical protein MAL05_01665 [Leptospira noguchii]
MNRLSLKELEEIKKRWEASTPGPWKSFIEGRDHTSGSDFIRTSKNDIELSGASLADQDFIANAKQDIPRLIAEIELLWKIMPNIE